MEKRLYQDLIAWKESHKLCLWIYKLTEKFPKTEIYRLVNQMCKSSQSVPTNIAEGNGRRTAKDKAHFFVIALSSLDELHYQCILAHDLKYITKEELNKAHGQIKYVSILLTKLRASFVKA